MADVGTDPRLEYAGKGMLLAWWAQQHPDFPAIVSTHGNRSFAELNARSNQLARALRSRGVTPGDGVALISGNLPQFSEVVNAAQRSGLRLTPVNWHLTGEEAGYVVDNCEAGALIADARHGEAAAIAAGAAPRAKVRLAIGGEIDGFEPYDEALDAEDDADLEDAEMGSTMLYTSGTTGRPKGVNRPQAQRQVGVIAGLFGYQPGQDVHLVTGPLYHAAPLAFSLAVPLASGAGVVLMERWDAEEALGLIEEHKVTHTHMVPTMFV
ncbi:MAG: AMP-binding protein, partial [Acidimicrobiales bacterium]